MGGEREGYASALHIGNSHTRPKNTNPSPLPLHSPPIPHPSLPLLSSGGGLHACSTSTYKLHYFETASGPPPCRHSRLSRFVSLRRGPCSLCRPPLRPLHRRIPASARAACHRQTPKATAVANRTRGRRLARDAAAAVCRHLRRDAHEESAPPTRRADHLQELRAGRRRILR